MIRSDLASIKCSNNDLLTIFLQRNSEIKLNQALRCINKEVQAQTNGDYIGVRLNFILIPRQMEDYHLLRSYDGIYQNSHRKQPIESARDLNLSRVRQFHSEPVNINRRQCIEHSQLLNMGRVIQFNSNILSPKNKGRSSIDSSRRVDMDRSIQRHQERRQQLKVQTQIIRKRRMSMYSIPKENYLEFSFRDFQCQVMRRI